ncbi:MAG: hypothetical protein KGL44_02365 [Sphingomonadales bacterium]|nr:hypothetical protein [Sphingomonadales bacterium]
MSGLTGHEIETPGAASPVLAAAAVRAEWTTPRVIVSELRDASAHVTHGSDGSSGSYKYGS